MLSNLTTWFFVILNIFGTVLNIKMNYRQLPPRVSDQKVFVADISVSRICKINC